MHAMLNWSSSGDDDADKSGAADDVYHIAASHVSVHVGPPHVGVCAGRCQHLQKDVPA